MASMEGDTSPLFWLPEEILELVVEQAPADSVPALLQTCRRLARIARKRLYAEIEYGGEDGPYDKLFALMDAQPHLRELVKDVTIAPVRQRHFWHGPAHMPYPGTARILAHFPSLETLRVYGASPDRVAKLLASAPAPLLPPLRHIAIELLAADMRRFSEFSWWESLASFPSLGEPTLHGQVNPRRGHADPGDRPQALAGSKGLHTLTIRQLPPPVDGPAAFADDLPALTSLTLEHGDSMVSRWLSIAPQSLTRITLSIVDQTQRHEVPSQLGRFPRLQHLRLVGCFELKKFVPFLRTDKLRRLELQYVTACEFAEDVHTLLDLICGPNRIRHLQSIHLNSDIDLCGLGYGDIRQCLRDAIKGDDASTLAELKSELNPFRGAIIEDSIRRLVEVACSNGINITGSALRSADWEQRFEDLVECSFVEHALATNDYTLLRRQFGKQGATEAIRRQRPLLAEMLSGEGS